MNKIERLVAYLMKIECESCGFEVYFPEDVEDEAKLLLAEYHGNLQDAIDQANRTCDYCSHMLTKDD
jgi:DNA-directed RNA polymerase subunit RPC12/RpoP